MKQAISEPEALEMNSRHLEQDLEKALEKHTLLVEQCASIEGVVRNLEDEIEEKKNFFISNDQANNLMLTTSDLDKSMQHIKSPISGQVSPEVKFSGVKTDKKYDSEASLVNIMKKKLLQLGKTYQKKMHKLEEYHCNFEFTHLQENHLDVDEMRKELERLQELTVTVDDSQCAPQRSDLFVIDEKPAKKVQQNRRDTRGKKTSQFEPNSSTENLYNSVVSEARQSRNSSKDAVQGFIRPQSGAFRKTLNMHKGSHKGSQLGQPIDMYRPGQNSNYSMSNSSHRSTVVIPKLSESQLEFLYNHAMIENYRYQNSILSKELAQISDENTALLRILEQQRNTAALNDSKLQTLKRELENKKEIMQYFETALIQGAQIEHKENLKESKLVIKGANYKLPTMMEPREFEMKKGYFKQCQAKGTA